MNALDNEHNYRYYTPDTLDQLEAELQSATLVKEEEPKESPKQSVEQQYRNSTRSNVHNVMSQVLLQKEFPFHLEALVEGVFMEVRNVFFNVDQRILYTPTKEMIREKLESLSPEQRLKVFEQQLYTTLTEQEKNKRYLRYGLETIDDLAQLNAAHYIPTNPAFYEEQIRENTRQVFSEVKKLYDKYGLPYVEANECEKLYTNALKNLKEFEKKLNINNFFDAPQAMTLDQGDKEIHKFVENANSQFLAEVKNMEGHAYLSEEFIWALEKGHIKTTVDFYNILEATAPDCPEHLKDEMNDVYERNNRDVLDLLLQNLGFVIADKERLLQGADLGAEKNHGLLMVTRDRLPKIKKEITEKMEAIGPQMNAQMEKYGLEEYRTTQNRDYNVSVPHHVKRMTYMDLLVAKSFAFPEEEVNAYRDQIQKIEELQEKEEMTAQQKQRINEIKEKSQKKLEILKLLPKVSPKERFTMQVLANLIYQYLVIELSESHNVRWQVCHKLDKKLFAPGKLVDTGKRVLKQTKTHGKLNFYEFIEIEEGQETKAHLKENERIVYALQGFPDIEFVMDHEGFMPKTTGSKVTKQNVPNKVESIHSIGDDIRTTLILHNKDKYYYVPHEDDTHEEKVRKALRIQRMKDFMKAFGERALGLKMMDQDNVDDYADIPEGSFLCNTDKLTRNSNASSSGLRGAFKIYGRHPLKPSIEVQILTMDSAMVEAVKTVHRDWYGETNWFKEICYILEKTLWPHIHEDAPKVLEKRAIVEQSVEKDVYQRLETKRQEAKEKRAKAFMAL